MHVEAGRCLQHGESVALHLDCYTGIHVERFFSAATMVTEYERIYQHLTGPS